MKPILPNEIAEEVGELISELQKKEWTISFARYDAQSFGNWYVDLDQKGNCIRLIKDRSQYIFSGPPIEEIQAAGLWKSFDDLHEFRHAVIKWVVQHSEREHSTK
jgi:hypothetical protein